MSFRPAISAPLPWLAILAARLLGGKRTGPSLRKRLLKFPRSLKVTREGKWFIGILFLIGIAAINTGNNLLYLIVATLLSLITVSGVISESTLKGVSIKREFPAHVFRGSPVPVRVTVENRKRFFPSFSFRVTEEPLPFLQSAPAYFLRVGPGGHAQAVPRYTFSQRGVHRLEKVTVATRFPFGLFLKGKQEDAPEMVTVYPAIRKIRTKDLFSRLHGAEDLSSKRKGSGVQLWGLRDYTLSDDSRHIHWKSSARTSRLFTKEFESEKELRATVILENHGRPGTIFESVAEQAASIASVLIERGYSVGLKTIESELPPGKGPAQLFRILTALAVAAPTGGPGKPSAKAIGY